MFAAIAVRRHLLPALGGDERIAGFQRGLHDRAGFSGDPDTDRKRLPVVAPKLRQRNRVVPTVSAETPNPLTFGIISTESAGTLTARFQPFPERSS
jgi:ABC-type phosphate/phosphonate transport system substrate-binding protein